MAATGLQDSWLISPSSNLSLPTSVSQPCPEAGRAGGVTWGMSSLLLPSSMVCPVQSSAALTHEKAHTQPAVLAARKSKCWPSALAAGMQKCKVKGTKALLPFSPLYLFIPLANLVWDAVCSMGSRCHPWATVPLIKSKCSNNERAAALRGGPILCKQQQGSTITYSDRCRAQTRVLNPCTAHSPAGPLAFQGECAEAEEADRVCRSLNRS